MSEVFHLRHPDEVLVLAGQLAAGCARPREVAIGLAELLVNAVEHGHLALGFETKRRLLASGQFEAEFARRLDCSPPLQVSVTRSCLPDLVRFVIEDPGPGFDWTPWLRPDRRRKSAPNGRGILLAREQCFESLNYRAPGNVVEALAARRR
ncbi:MAG: ATP-binding protein [Rhodocyclaceae bacterium]|nr:ATP-binding protein [Rhodocyclaceae bacterium]